MDLTRDFLNKIEEMSEPHQIKVGERIFADKDMSALPCGPLAQDELNTSTLSSIVDYIKTNTDGEVLSGRPIVHIVGPTLVCLYREMNADKIRDRLVCAACDNATFPFGRWLDTETFIIQLQANFVQEEATAALLAFVASVRQDTSVTQQDSGVAQSVTAKKGVSLSYTAQVPNPVTLRPFRTFAEVEQPASSFVFRVRSDESGVTMALFTADGNAWKNEAITNIRGYFQDALGNPLDAPEGNQVIILA